MMEKKQQNLENIVSARKSNWQERTQRHKENPAAYNRAFEIALLVMDIMEEKGWNQTKLAEAMNVTRQAVSKILKGNRPINMATIDKLETALGRPLLVVPSFKLTKTEKAVFAKLITIEPIHLVNIISSIPKIQTTIPLHAGGFVSKTKKQNQYSLAPTRTNHG